MLNPFDVLPFLALVVRPGTPAGRGISQIVGRWGTLPELSLRSPFSLFASPQ